MVRPLSLSECPDGALVQSARSGDVAAYEEIVGRYGEAVFRAAYLVTRSTPDAQEVAQDVFVKAHSALDRFRTDAPLRPWLLQIALNESRNRLRATARRDALTLRAAVERPPEPPDQAPEAAVLASERRRQILAGLERLRQEDQLAIACRFFLDLSEREAAQVLGWRPGTFKSRLSRAMGRLRAELEDPGDE